jgi:hypothetical protein
MQSKVTIKDRREPDTDYDFWMTKSPDERIEAVEFLREQCYLAMGYSEPPAIARVVKVTERTK